MREGHVHERLRVGWSVRGVNDAGQMGVLGMLCVLEYSLVLGEVE